MRYANSAGGPMGKEDYVAARRKVLRRMRGRLLTIAAVAVAAVGCGVAGALAGDEPPAQEVEPFLPTVEIISPRNGAVQTARAVVVKSKVGNFQLAPRHFGKEPELG